VKGVTTEQLRLEIQLQAKEALKELALTATEVKRVAEEAKKATPHLESFKAITARLQGDLKASATTAKFFGDEVGGLRERQGLLKQAMVELIQNGISPQTAQMQRLKADYDQTSSKLQSFGNENDNLTTKIQKLAEAGAALAAARQVAAFAGEAVKEFAGAEASAQRLEAALQMRGMEDSLPALDALASKLQNVMGIDGDLVKQLEAELVAQGKTTEQTRKTIEAAAGLSAVTGDDLATNVQKLAMTYSGAQGRIGNLIPVLKDLTDEQLQQGAAIDVVLAKYKGFIGRTGETGIALGRMNEGIGDAKEALGEGLAPQARLIADLIGDLVGWLSSASPMFKEIAGVVATVVVAALVGLAIRTAAAAAASWGLFGAEMAKNAAMAVGNPLIWAGIAAALAAVAATGLLVAAKMKEASTLAKSNELTKEASAGYRDVGSSARAATSAIAALTKAQEDLNKKAADWKSSWADEFGKFKAEKADDPYASVEYDREKKLASAKASGIEGISSGENRRIIDEINAYYNAKRRAVLDELAKVAAEQAGKEEADAETRAIRDIARLAELSGSKELILEAERASYLATTKDTETLRAAMIRDFDKQLTAAKIEDARKVFEEEFRLAKEQGQWGHYAALSAQDYAKNTEVGKMLGWGGQPPQDWKQVLLDSAINLAMENESVKKVLNIFSTLLRGIVEIVLPPLAKALTWLYDSVFVPVGNAIIGLINGIINLVNKIPFIEIALIEPLKTSKQIQEEQEAIATKTKAVSDAMESIRSIFEERKRDIDDAYQKNVGSLKNLLELGAISEADYAARIGIVNAGKVAELATLDATEKDQIKVLEDILQELKSGKNVDAGTLAAAGAKVAEAASNPSVPTVDPNGGGTGSTAPSVLPTGLSVALRSDDIDFERPLGNRQRKTDVTNVTVIVEGSVTSDDDLVEKVAKGIAKRGKYGYLEVVD